MDEFLLVDKRAGISSAAVVNKVKWLLGAAKAGHCGTLDPLATGLLILCFGRATKLAQFVIGSEKTYEATIVLGATSTTYDADGEITRAASAVAPALAQIEQALRQFVGTISQKPPIYSALKVGGRPLYEYARKQKPVDARVREVEVRKFEVLDYHYPELRVCIECSTGTYVRSLAHDLGQVLEGGGYIDALRRTGIGPHRVESAIALEEIARLCESGTLEEDPRYQSARRSIESMLDLPVLNLTPEREAVVEQGVPIRGDDVLTCAASVHADDIVALKSSTGRLLAVGRALCDAAQMAGCNGNRVFEYMRVM